MTAPLARCCALALLVAPSACTAAVAGAGAAAGALAYEEHQAASDESVLAYPPERVYAAAEEVAAIRGTWVRAHPRAWRVECQVDRADVSIVVLVVPGAENVARLRVSAREGLRGRDDVARDVALGIRLRLQERSS